jgi:hypothetical protein
MEALRCRERVYEGISAGRSHLILYHFSLLTIICMNQYTKQGKPFATRLQNDNYGIVLPLNSAKEWRALPHDELSFLHALAEVNPVISFNNAQVNGLIIGDE